MLVNNEHLFYYCSRIKQKVLKFIKLCQKNEKKS